MKLEIIADKYFDNYIKKDIYIGSALNISTIKEAKYFLYYLFTIDNITLPHIAYNDTDKEINFYWNNDSRFILDLGFKGDGFYSYYCKLSNGKEFVEDQVNIESHLPKEIIAEINYQGN